MKGLVFLLVFLTAMPCAAQKNLFKELTGRGFLKKVFSKKAPPVLPALQEKARQQFLRNAHARQVQGKILLAPKPTVSPNMAAIERHIFSSIPTDGGMISLLQEPTSRQMVHALRLYNDVMSKFQAFKKETDPFLYYQSKPSERRTLTPVERGQWAEKISRMHAQLMRLKPVASPADPGYKAAREYVAFAADVLSPFLRGTLLANKWARRDREYDFEEFFLHTPKAKKEPAWKDVLPENWRTKLAAGKLPKGLKMAVLNDNPNVLSRMEEFHRAGLFFPQWQISYYQDTEDILRDASASPKSFDVILTDIIVPGGGGSYLTGMLRERGFAGAIIALSAFEENAHMGRKMFDIGFDGMIPQEIGFEKGRHWPLQIMQKLENYFYYRNLHKWDR